MANTSGISDTARVGRRVARAPAVPLPVCRVRVDGSELNDQARATALIEHEWLLTNGIGGYSSGTVAGVITRRYHGLLVAALPNPLGRMVMLNRVDDALDVRALRDFHLDAGIPMWEYVIDGRTLRKRIAMPYRQNTIVIQYSLDHNAQSSLTLRLTPGIHFRNYEAPVSEPLHEDYEFATDAAHFRVTAPGHWATRSERSSRATTGSPIGDATR